MDFIFCFSYSIFFSYNELAIYFGTSHKTTVLPILNCIGVSGKVKPELYSDDEENDGTTANVQLNTATCLLLDNSIFMAKQNSQYFRNIHYLHMLADRIRAFKAYRDEYPLISISRSVPTGCGFKNTSLFESTFEEFLKKDNILSRCQHFHGALKELVKEDLKMVFTKIYVVKDDESNSEDNEIQKYKNFFKTRLSVNSFSPV